MDTPPGCLVTLRTTKVGLGVLEARSLGDVALCSFLSLLRELDEGRLNQLRALRPGEEGEAPGEAGDELVSCAKCA